MKIKRDKVDKVFSDLIREARDWHCEYCNKDYSENRQRLQASHYCSRRYQPTRFDPNNVFAHCFRCHNELGSNPPLFYLWVRKEIGAGMSEIVFEKAMQKKFRRPKKEKEAMYQHYKEELARVKELRAQGKKGHIKITGWE